MPETVVFKQNSEGDLAARIGDLEVGFFGEGDGCYIVVWGTETGVPCGYTNSECPEEKKRVWRNCPKADNCPYEFTRAIEVDSTVMMNEGTRAELEAKMRDVLKKERDESCFDLKWPPGASVFAVAPWQFEE